MNKSDLMEKIVYWHTRFEEDLGLIQPEQMETPFNADDWSVKDVLVHLTSWEQVLLADYARLTSGEKIHELNGQDEIDAHNAETRNRAKNMPFNQVMVEFQTSYRQLLAWLESLPESDLEIPFAYGMSLGEFIAEDTWKHYSEHTLKPDGPAKR